MSPCKKKKLYLAICLKKATFHDNLNPFIETVDMIIIINFLKSCGKLTQEYEDNF